jgi:hypothetical protein
VVSIYATSFIGFACDCVCHPERSAAESKDPVELLFGYATGLKAWPRGLRPLRCSLDFARNDEVTNSWHRQPCKDSLDDGLTRHRFGFGFVADDDAVP